MRWEFSRIDINRFAEFYFSHNNDVLLIGGNIKTFLIT